MALIPASHEKGAVFIPFVFALIIFLGAAALAVDMGTIYTARRQMQFAADAAAMAGVRELAKDNQATAKTKALQVANANKVMGSTIQLNTTNDVEFGSWAAPTFTPGGTPTNAMRVTLRRTAAANGALNLFFGPALGKPSVNLTVKSIAILAAVDVAMVLDRSSSMVYNTTWVPNATTHWVSLANCLSSTTSPYYHINDPEINGNYCTCGTPDATGLQPFKPIQTAGKSFVGDFNPITDAMALISFDGSATTDVQLVGRNNPASFATVTTGVDAMTAPTTCSSSQIHYTNIGAGIAAGIAELNSSRHAASSVKMMVLLSDGQPNCSTSSSSSCGVTTSGIAASKTYATQQAASAAASKIVIHTISFGTGADRATMQAIATATGGSEYYAATTADLSAVFAAVRNRVPVQLVN